jgi:hypothetical protein
VEKIWDRKHDVAIDHARNEAAPNVVNPAVSIDFGAGQTEGGFTTEANAASFTTVKAAVLSIPHGFWVSTVEHFLNNSVVIFGVVARVFGLEFLPMVEENMFEGVFINVRPEGCFILRVYELRGEGGISLHEGDDTEFLSYSRR